MTERPATGSAADLFPTHILGRPEVRELPPPPDNTAQIIGPGIVAAGVGLASGEFILYPYIASQVGLVFVWAALVGVMTQFFLNMEIERYTLATGETALTGFSRFWRHWGLVFALMTYFANLWPGWATSSATMITYLVGGEPRWIAIGMLVVIGLILTLAPGRLRGARAAADGEGRRRRPAHRRRGDLRHHRRGLEQPAADRDAGDASRPSSSASRSCSARSPSPAPAAARTSASRNWIRDKGFGMGKLRAADHEPGHRRARGGAEHRLRLRADGREPRRAGSAGGASPTSSSSRPSCSITFVTITFTSLLAYATVYGEEGLANSIDFVRREGEVLTERVGAWFGALFWFIGAFSLFAAATGIVDYTSRLAADVLRTSYLKGHNESRLYFVLVWGLVVIGILVLLAGFTQPLVLLVISACVGGLMMFMYSVLLILLNRRVLSPEIRPGTGRVAALVWAFLLFGVLSVLRSLQQLPKLWGGG